jgi:7-cyano-7-deazaguanine synthase
MKTVVLLSGGIDSTVALAHVIDKGHECALAISFDYGQNHQREINHAATIAAIYNCPHIVINLRSAFPQKTALTGNGDIPERHADSVDATFVPGRNLTMIAAAVGIGAQLKARAVVIGANADDNAGYPDCRPAFIASIDNTARKATDGRIGIWAPLLRMNKTQIVQQGFDLKVPLHLTYSCYRGAKRPCFRCGACESRFNALREAAKP